jgi:cytochrome c553
MSAKLVAILPLLAAVGLGTTTCLAAGTKEAGQAKSTACIACHGLDGNSANPEWPNLAGQNAAYLVRQLQAFRGGQRQNALMTPMATPLSDQDIDDLAAWFSAQTVKGGEADPTKVELGQRVYRSGNLKAQVTSCAGCHGPAGHGNAPAGYAALHGQHATYVAAQLRAYKAGDRTTDPNEMMRNVAALLSDDEIDAVAAYIQGLR